MSVSENNMDGPQLAKLDEAVITKVEQPAVAPAPKAIDNNFAVFLSKCQATKKPYLIKYKRNITPSNIEGLSLETQFFKLQGSFPVDDTYFQLSDNTPTNQKISSGELVGFPIVLAVAISTGLVPVPVAVLCVQAMKK
nr:TerY-C metal binding domain-containing protein [Paraflavitalea speifideiaquila]